MATLSRLKQGQILYEVRKVTMGNTRMTTDALYTVKVIDIDLEGGFAVVSWNGNAPTRYYERNLKKLKVKEPVVKSEGMCGQLRY